MAKPKTYVEMLISANEYADEKVKEKYSVSWMQHRDNFLGAICFNEIIEHEDKIYKK